MTTKKMRAVTMLLASVGLAMTLPGCANMPGLPGAAGAGAADDGACAINQTAVGAVVGTGVGVTAGYLVSHNAVGATIGGLVGAGIGGFLGNEEDQRCQQVAEAKALQQVTLYAQAHPSALPVETVAQSEAPVSSLHHRSRYKPHTPTYLPAETYTNSKTGTSGSEVAMTPYIDKDSGEECTNIRHTATKSDGTTQTAVATKCRTPPAGDWQTVAQTS